MMGRTLRRGIALAIAGIALPASGASLTEATPVPIGARVRLSGSRIQSSDRIGVLVTRDDTTIRLQVHGSEVVTIQIADIDGIEVSQGKKISWKNVAIGTATGVGLAALVHGPGDPHSYFINGRAVSGSSCGDLSFTCSNHPSFARALTIGIFGGGGLIYRSDRWVAASPADLRRPPTQGTGAPQAGPPEPAQRSVTPADDESRARTRIRLTLLDGVGRGELGVAVRVAW